MSVSPIPIAEINYRIPNLKIMTSAPGRNGERRNISCKSCNTRNFSIDISVAVDLGVENRVRVTALRDANSGTGQGGILACYDHQAAALAYREMRRL